MELFITMLQELVILEKGRVEAILLSESCIKPGRRITLYDDGHTFASHVDQDVSAQAILTIGENLTLGGLAQAAYRMRGLKDGRQPLRLVYQKKIKHLITQTEHVTMAQVIAFATANEGRLLGEDHYLSDRDKMVNTLRRVILDKALKTQSAKEMVAIFKQFYPLFISVENINPGDLYGMAEKECDPKRVLDIVKNKKRKSNSGDYTFIRSRKTTNKRGVSSYRKWFVSHYSTSSARWNSLHL